MSDTNWTAQCPLVHCVDPYLQPHHHHFILGTFRPLSNFACQCGNIDQPGTKPKDK